MMVQELFDEAIGDAPPSRVDVDRVVRRQRRALRLRTGLAAVAGVAVLAAAAGVVVQVGGEAETTTPAWELDDPLAGFPEYLQGTRVVAATAASSRETLTLTFTPATLDLVLFLRCEGHGLEPGYELRAAVSVGDATVQEQSCGEYEYGVWRDDGEQALFWYMMGIEVDEPVTITAELTAARHAVYGDQPELGVPEQGTFGMAVAELVPFEEYQFPSPPEVLDPLPEPAVAGTVVRADPADPLAPVEITFPWDPALVICEPEAGQVYPLELVSQTPGILRVLIHGIEVTEQTWWDYQGEARSAALSPLCGEHYDDELTLRVEPAYVTGDWQVVINTSG